ncbi:hypothetical protein ABZ345_08960 [Lentzea sp. NPDC005914]|uniref:hypothetical protein n=1 Tax=Lentzea sp. NPDC005914 TaxID=3154572 RepID=UPI0033C23C9E
MSSWGRRLSAAGLAVAAALLVAGQAPAIAGESDGSEYPCGISKDDVTPKRWHAKNCAPQRNREVWVSRYSGPPDGPDCVPARTERIYDNSYKLEWTGAFC